MAKAIDDQALFGVNWRGAILGGVVGGLAFLVVLMALAPAMGYGAAVPIRYIAAMALGPQVLPPPEALTLGIMLAALAVHLLLSILYAFLIGAYVRHRPTTVAVLLGMTIALVIYLLNFYVFAAAYPWFTGLRGLITILAHLIYGGVTAAIYVRVEESYSRRVPDPARSA